ncbi:DUF3888 domain-containing protein [Metabacillus niabensis]|uniref:DUF3888 domain-containing protein n=1 Tax=Metabacillus niabensis TaxID=324854 RepID=UPI001CFC4109|nr:DUF3888 domain-containing protein [Metabacillus niabensis]
MEKFTKSLALLFIIFFNSTYFVNAEEYHRKGYAEDLYNVTQNVTQEQYFKNFTIELFLPFIVNSTQHYYNDESATGISFNWEDNYNVVEISQPENQEKASEYSFIIKFTVNVHNGDMNNHKIFGTDTLTFGINSFIFARDDIKEFPAIKLIDYKHRKPTN